MSTVLCVGTGTEVGKTWAGARVLGALRASGLQVAARKPVQSFDPADPHPTDAEVLAAATGEDVAIVCPRHRWLPLPMAPPIAASRLGQRLGSLAELVADMADVPAGIDVLWVETVGGVRSPVADDGDSADLARWVHPQLTVLVADAGLGTINAVRLSVVPFAGRDVVVLLNRYDADDPVHVSNAGWLLAEGLHVVTDTGALASLLLERLAR